MKYITFIFCFLFATVQCQSDDAPTVEFELLSFFNGPTKIDLNTPIEGVSTAPIFDLVFSESIDSKTFDGFTVVGEGSPTVLVNESNGGANIRLVISGLQTNKSYELRLAASITSVSGQSMKPRVINFKTAKGALTLTNIAIKNGKDLQIGIPQLDIPRKPVFELTFDKPVSQPVANAITINGGNAVILPTEGTNKILFEPRDSLASWRKYNLLLSDKIEGNADEAFEEVRLEFFTALDTVQHFPTIEDEALLDLVQERTLGYFWDFGHPNSGLARERSTSGNTVTTGGSGFGLMAMVVGVERGFITREAALERWQKVVSFLATADRFHGVWPHWLDGNTGKVRPFSAKDNGGDLVETSFLAMGLITVREYLNAGNEMELALKKDINELLNEIEWDWHKQPNKEVLTWHWSPEFGFDIDLGISGHNESLIVYVLAAGSTSHSIDKEVYTKGYARDGNFLNGRDFLGITLPAGPNFGGPLFFSHYSFLGLNPTNLEDEYFNYWEQNINHTKINRAYCAQNLKRFLGYSENCWGLTASDSPGGYRAHSPTNDNGTITPTAALSAMPYTPTESMEALRFFYYNLGDKIWGEYGFKDAFNPTENWYTDSYLAIDQGPIVCMIENHRSGLLWQLFMGAPEVQAGLEKLDFNY